jgi:hypothetical protein
MSKVLTISLDDLQPVEKTPEKFVGTFVAGALLGASLTFLALTYRGDSAPVPPGNIPAPPTPPGSVNDPARRGP